MEYVNTLYKIEVVKKKNKKRSDSDIADGKIGVPIFIKEDRPAWFCCFLPEDKLVPWHRMKTSTVKKVYVEEDSKIVVETQNTIYNFIIIKDSSLDMGGEKDAI